MSTARTLPRSHTWLRALVLLLTLLAPVTHADLRAMPAAPSVETTVEYDALAPTTAALRPASPAAPRPTAPLRPAPHTPEDRPLPAPHGPTYTLRAQHTVILRC